MLTKEQNERLTSVEGDAPLARLMRDNYWIPFSRTQALEVGAAPTRVRLFGRNYVAWRAPDGRVGFIDERCPHRGVSMALARVEGCALRCLFHGWLVDVSGKVIDVPTEGDRSALIAERVPVNQYRTVERGGLVWAWLGQGEPPEFPDFAWLDLPEENLWMTRSLWPVSWLQGLEAALDTAHVGYLHSGWARQPDEMDDQSQRFKVSPRFSIDETDYGMRSAGVRTCDDGLALVRISEFLLPFIAMTPGSLNGEKGEASLYLFVPVDDHNHLQFFGFFSQHAPLGSFFMRDRCTDPDNYVDVKGSRADNWGQDRAAMADGHFSGFVDHVLLEDAVVQASIGSIADRTLDFLTHIDLGIQSCRQLLLRAIERFEAGEPVDGSMPAVTRSVIARGALIPAESDWREIR
jgi:phenylpropionate dioxygenase-like ring-hydroxylating dioxygenase large terminal subunit